MQSKRFVSSQIASAYVRRSRSWTSSCWRIAICLLNSTESCCWRIRWNSSEISWRIFLKALFIEARRNAVHRIVRHRDQTDLSDAFDRYPLVYSVRSSLNLESLWYACRCNFYTLYNDNIHRLSMFPPGDSRDIWLSLAAHPSDWSRADCWAIHQVPASVASLLGRSDYRKRDRQIDSENRPDQIHSSHQVSVRFAMLKVPRQPKTDQTYDLQIRQLPCKHRKQKVCWQESTFGVW